MYLSKKKKKNIGRCQAARAVLKFRGLDQVL